MLPQRAYWAPGVDESDSARIAFAGMEGPHQGARRRARHDAHSGGGIHADTGWPNELLARGEQHAADERSSCFDPAEDRRRPRRHPQRAARRRRVRLAGQDQPKPAGHDRATGRPAIPLNAVQPQEKSMSNENVTAYSSVAPQPDAVLIPFLLTGRRWGGRSRRRRVRPFPGPHHAALRRSKGEQVVERSCCPQADVVSAALHDRAGEPEPRVPSSHQDTQGSFSTEAAAVTVLWGLIAFGQIQPRRIVGYNHLPYITARRFARHR